MTPATLEVFEKEFLPKIEHHVKWQFPDSHPDAADCRAESAAFAWEWFSSAHDRCSTGGVPPAMTPNTLAQFASSHVRSGRRVSGSSKCCVMSPQTRIAGRSSICSLDSEHETRGRLVDYLTNKRSRSPAEQARARIDIAAIRATLTQRQSEVFDRFLLGDRPSEIAEALGVSCARITQIRLQIAARFSEAGYNPA